MDGWQAEDLLTETMLLEGFPLDSTMTPQAEFKRNHVVLVESDACAHRLFVCLDEAIHDDTITHLQMRAEDVFVCLDSALSDEAKMQLSDGRNIKVI